MERRIDSGDRQGEAVYQAMIYQIAKEIGAVYRGEVGLRVGERVFRALNGGEQARILLAA